MLFVSGICLSPVLSVPPILVAHKKSTVLKRCYIKRVERAGLTALRRVQFPILYTNGTD